MPDIIGTFDLDNFIQRYLTGESLGKLATLAHVDYRKARQILVDRGIRIRWRGETIRITLPMDQVREMSIGGMLIYEIARHFKVSTLTLTRRMREEGIEPVSKSEVARRMISRLTEGQRLSRGRQMMRGNPSKEGRARTNERSVSRISPLEKTFGRWLNERGIGFAPQKAVGPYNLDFAILPRIAVEIFGGGWHFQPERFRLFRERSKYLFDRGWSIVVVRCAKRDFPLSSAAADQVATFSKLLRRDPSLRCEYRMIRGDGKLVSSGRYKGDDLSFISATTRVVNG